MHIYHFHKTNVNIFTPICIEIYYRPELNFNKKLRKEGILKK